MKAEIFHKHPSQLKSWEIVHISFGSCNFVGFFVNFLLSLHVQLILRKISQVPMNSKNSEFVRENGGPS